MTASHSGRLGEIRARLDDLAGPDPHDDERELLARLLRSFTIKTAPAVDRLAAVLREGDAEDVRERAHGLKGSAANVGAGTLAGIFADLEHRARAGALPGPAALLDAVRAELDLVVPALMAVADELDPLPAG
jgi:HPt (histidine-containing phosphotransfer) domain-containing protein